MKAWEKISRLIYMEKMNLKCILLCYVWWQRSRQFTKMYSLKSRSITLVFEKGRINFIKEFFWETFLCNSYIFCFVCKLSIQWWINIFFEYGIYLSRWFRNDRTYIPWRSRMLLMYLGITSSLSILYRQLRDSLLNIVCSDSYSKTVR